MRYDDRLLTVLNQPAGDRRDAAVRWRQLVDLIARAGPNSASPTVAQAIDEIRNQRSDIDEDLRAAAARAVAALPLPLALLEVFASDRLAVCAPILAAASLRDRALVPPGKLRYRIAFGVALAEGLAGVRHARNCTVV